MRLIHITDPHLSSLESERFPALRGKRWSGYLSWRRKRRHVHQPEVLAELVEAVRRENADQLLLTGDLMHIGLEQEARSTAAWLEQLGEPGRVMLVPGNHDIYARDSDSFLKRHWADYLPGADWPTVRDRGSVRLVGLNSSVVTRIFSAAGELGPEQLAAVPDCLAPERFNVILIHHPPLPGITSRRKAMRDDAAFETMLQRHPADMVLYGHTHRNQEQVNGPMRLYGTASASDRERASYRVFDVHQHDGGWTVDMQLKSRSGDQQAAFETVQAEQWEVRR